MSETGGSGDVVPSGAPSGSTSREALPASAWETVDELVAAVVDVDRAIHAMTAWRTLLIDQARRLGEAVQHSTQTRLSSASDIPRRTMVAELACALRVSERSMGAQVDTAQLLVERFPATLEAMRRGDLSARHAEVVVQTTSDLDATERADAEQHLIELGCRQNVPRFRTAARRWRERHHPRGLTERHREARERRCLVLDPAADGMAWLSALLPDPQAFAMFDRLDAAAAVAAGPDENRTAAQLRADVLADVVLDPDAAAVLHRAGAEHCSGDTGPGGGGAEDTPTGVRPPAPIRAQVHVTVPVLTLLGKADEPGHLDGYGPIDAATARELAAGAPSFTRLLTDPHTGAVLSVGRDRYRVPADLRRYLRLRDETCRFPGCGRRAVGCDIDHTLAWQHGGTTCGENLAHLCRHHHRLKHEGGWDATVMADGNLRWTSAAGRTYVTEPAMPIGPVPLPHPIDAPSGDDPDQETRSTPQPSKPPGSSAPGSGPPEHVPRQPPVSPGSPGPEEPHPSGEPPPTGEVERPQDGMSGMTTRPERANPVAEGPAPDDPVITPLGDPPF